MFAYLYRTPKVGKEINIEGYVMKEIANYNHIYSLLKEEEAYEIVRVGSKGILFEAEELAKIIIKILFKRKIRLIRDIREKTAGAYWL